MRRTDGRGERGVRLRPRAVLRASFALLLLALAASCERVITVRGLVRQVGNAPHVETVITGVAEGEEVTRTFYLKGDKVADCAAFYGQVVLATGVVTVESLKQAKSSAPPRDRYWLEVRSVEPAP